MATNVVLHCWGRNVAGQLGDGTTASRTSPQTVGGGLYAWAVLAGYNHACAVTWEGPTYCWGSNTFGALGDGTTTSTNIPVRVVY
jgi:alpha-tubulin suppressor-like RCC1 family protein